MSQNAVPKYGWAAKFYSFWPITWSNINIFNEVNYFDCLAENTLLSQFYAQ